MIGEVIKYMANEDLLGHLNNITKEKIIGSEWNIGISLPDNTNKYTRKYTWKKTRGYSAWIWKLKKCTKPNIHNYTTKGKTIKGK